MKRLFLFLLALLFAISSLAGCAKEEEEERQPDFETLNIRTISASRALATGIEYSYITPCAEDENARTEGMVKVIEYGPCEAPEGKSSSEGCTWRKLTLKIVYGDENANESGFTYRYCMADYYDIRGVHDSLRQDPEKSRETFQIRMDGKKYECEALISENISDWVMDSEGMQSCTMELTWTLMLPEGYDGICCSLYDAQYAAKVEECKYIDAYYIEDAFLIFKLD